MCIRSHYIIEAFPMISTPSTTRLHSSKDLRERLLHQRWEGTLLVRSRGQQSTSGSGKSGLKPTSAKYNCPEPLVREKKAILSFLWRYCCAVHFLYICLLFPCCNSHCAPSSSASGNSHELRSKSPLMLI